MDIGRWVSRLNDEFYAWGGFNSYPVRPEPYINVCKAVVGMSSPSNMHLLNLAVQCMSEDEIYLEVGTWRGRTLIGALLGNDARGIAIDDDTMDEHDGDSRSSQDVWHENVKRFEMADRVQYINGSIPDVWGRLVCPYPAGVYLFDGDKSTTEAAYAGLEGVLPFLAKEALIFVDDANELPIRQAVSKLERTYRDHVFKLMDLPTPGNTWPMWWNGVIVIGWRA